MAQLLTGHFLILKYALVASLAPSPTRILRILLELSISIDDARLLPDIRPFHFDYRHIRARGVRSLHEIVTLGLF